MSTRSERILTAITSLDRFWLFGPELYGCSINYMDASGVSWMLIEEDNALFVEHLRTLNEHCVSRFDKVAQEEQHIQALKSKDRAV